MAKIISQKDSKKNLKKAPNIFGPVPKGKMPKSIFGNVFFYIFAFAVGFLILQAVSSNEFSKDERPINELINLIQEEKVQNITVAGDTLEVQLRDGSEFVSKKESGISFDEILRNNDVDRNKIAGEVTIDQRLTFDQILIPLLSFGLPILILLFIFRQMRGASGDIFSFGKSRAKLFNKGAEKKVTFADVAGIEEAKEGMLEIVDFLKHPEKYRKVGARIPKGVLLVGPSGVGKTLLAKAIAGEADVPFFSVAGSEFMEMLVGVGSARARDLFKVAQAAQPSLIFIDEIDAIGRQRGMGIGGGHDEREQTLNQILIEMDGFDERTNVIVLAATNREDMLDPALVRAGRFDRRIMIPLPDLTDREAITKIHMRGKPFEDTVSPERIAKKTVGFSGADIENMLNEAAILAAKNNRTKIDPSDIEEASLKVTMGSQRRALQTDEEKKMTAFHEAGHAVVASSMPQMDPVRRVTIIPRGGALGHTNITPERDRYNETQTRLESIIASMLGGRAAEELVFNELTIGAANDIQKATEIARKMVTEFGMSELGPVSYDGQEGRFWIARQIGERAQYSQDVASKIDKEVKRIIDKGFTRAKRTLLEKREVLDKVSGILLEKETIDGDEFLGIIGSS